MEGNEISWESNSVSALFHIQIMSSFSSNNPLFSCIVTVYTLFLLYFPQAFRLFLSPVFLLTSLLLFFLLRLGALQRIQTPNPLQNDTREAIESVEISKHSSHNNNDNILGVEEKYGLSTHADKWVETGFDLDPLNSDFEESFVEWNVRAPLEVIYESYEGEENDDYDANYQNQTPIISGLERYPSLSMYYPETDSDSSSDGDFSVTGDWDSPGSVCFKWEEEDRDGLLIEIALDHKNGKKNSGSGLDLDLGFQVEEDNLIEIDISPPNNDAFSGEV